MNILLENNNRYLPHIDEPNHYQFITFRTQDSIDPYLKKVEHQNLSNSQQ